MTFQDIGATDLVTSPTTGQPVPRVVVRPRGTPAIEGATSWSPPPPAPGATADPLAGATAWEPPPAEPPPRQTGRGEAAAGGALQAATFGGLPAMVGAQAAGEVGRTPEDEAASAAMGGEDAMGRLIGGAYSALRAHFAGETDNEKLKAYNRGREAALKDQNLQEEQHPGYYLAGQLGGALVTAPLLGGAGGAARGLSTAARVARTAGAGAVSGGAFGAGEALSEGQSEGDIATSALTGAGVGAGVGALGSTAAEGAGAVGRKVVKALRGSPDYIEQQAAQKTGTALRHDIAERGIPFTPQEAAAGQAAGTPLSVMDVGSTQTHGLARWASVASEDAKGTFEDFLLPRASYQGPRLGQAFRNAAGGAYSRFDDEALKSLSRRRLKPLYDRAYRAGDRQLWSDELEHLSNSDAVRTAAKAAERKGSNWAVAEGYGGFNPHVTVKNGLIKIDDGKGGVPTFPNLQFWDYVHRELADMAERAKGPVGQSTTDSTALGTLDRQLKAELDKMVPEYADARGMAKAGFKSREAMELGREIAHSNMPQREVDDLLKDMNPVDRELLKRAFAAEIADTIGNLGNASGQSAASALNHIFIKSPEARRRIQSIMGADAPRLEALMRFEATVQKAAKILGGSDTARKLAGMAAQHTAAGGAVGALESIREGDVNPKTLIAAMLTGGLAYNRLHARAALVDSKVAARVAEMLTSTDPQMFAAGINTVVRNGRLMEAFRRVTDAIGKVTVARDTSGRGVIAATTVALEKLLGEGEQPEHGQQHDNILDMGQQ